MERVEFAEKKANAGAKRWKESTAKTETAPESTPKPEKAQLSTAKQRKAQLSTVKPNKQTYRHTDSIPDSANALSGADAQPVGDSPPLADCPPEPEELPVRKPDVLFQEFCLQFQSAHAGEPYAYKPADFVKLADLRKRYAKAKPQPWEVTVERFRQAAGHYFESDLATHTLADLCERFSTFFRNAVDRWNKPITNGNGNGKTEISKNGNDANRGNVGRTTEEDGIRDCPLL
jgi:hypothetical protein